MPEDYSIADSKQTDFVFRVDAQTEDPLRPELALTIRSLRMTSSWMGSPVLAPGKHPGLISFRMDWMDLLAVKGTLKSLLQHHSSKASIFHSA